MWPAFKRFFTDQVYFVQVLRSAVALAGVLLSSGVIDLGALNAHLGPLGWWVGSFLVPIAIFMRAGERNAPAP